MKHDCFVDTVICHCCLWIQFVETPDPQYDLKETDVIQPKIISARYIDVKKQ